jgi:hypothetical protein
MEMLSETQLAGLSQIPGLHEIFTTARDEFIQNADDPTAMRDIRDRLNRDAGELIQSASDNGLINLARYQAADPVGQLLTTFVEAGQNATNFLNQTPTEQAAAYAHVMDGSERNLLLLRDKIQILQNTFAASLIQGLGFGNIEDMASDENFEAAQEKIAAFGDALSKIREFVMELAGLVDVNGSGSITTAMVAGIGVMFAAQGLVTLAMVGGVKAAMAAAALAATPVGAAIAAAAAVVYAIYALDQSLRDPADFIAYVEGHNEERAVTSETTVGESVLGLSASTQPSAMAANQVAGTMATAEEQFGFNFVSPYSYEGSDETPSNINMTAENAWRHGESGEAFLRQLVTETSATNRLLSKVLEEARNGQ